MKKQNCHSEHFDKLSASLVSESQNIDTPYELPEGWKWCRLGDVFEVNPKIKADDTLLASFVPMEKIEPKNRNQFSFSVDLWGKIKKNHTQFQNGDVCFAKISPCFENGKAFIADGLENGIGAGTTELIVLRNKDIDSKYTFHFISTENFIRKGCTTYSGTVGQQRISMDFVKNLPFPLPPTLAEQQRIVNRIETMFAKLDEAQEKAQAVLDSFETRKAAILHKAITGELTAKWRKENGVADESWEEKSLEKIADVGSSKRVFTTEFTESGIPFYRGTEIGALAEKKSIKNELFISEMHYEELIKCSGKPEIGDLLLPSICPDGRIWNVDRNEPFYFKDGRVLWIHFQNKDNDSLYIKSYLINEFTQNYLKYASGSTFAELKIFALKSIIIKLPSLPEQQEIVRILDTVLEKESRAKEAAQTVLDQIALLKKSILARAFRGEL